MPVDWNAIIEQAASEPKVVSIDGQTVEAQRLSDILDAAGRSNTAGVEQPHRGLRITKLRAPGSSGTG